MDGRLFAAGVVKVDRACIWVFSGRNLGDVHVSDAGAKYVLGPAGEVVCESCGAKTGVQINGVRYDVLRMRRGGNRYSASPLALLSGK